MSHKCDILSHASIKEKEKKRKIEKKTKIIT